jgi:diguanylate cyclase (GGDEF)-like protein
MRWIEVVRYFEHEHWAVLTIVLLIGMLNFALGFALAMWFRGLLVLPGPIWLSYAPEGSGSAESPDSESAITSLVSAPPADAKAVVASAPCEAIPAEWTERLEENGIRPASCFEAVLWIGHLELPLYREQLVLHDQQFRSGESEELPLEALRQVNEDWTRQVSNWVTTLLSQDVDSPHAEQRDRLEEMLLDHSFQIQSVTEEITAIHEGPDRPGKRQGLLLEVGKLFDAINTLRDGLDNTLAELLRNEQRIDTIPDSEHTDMHSETYSRLGLETIFDMWWSNDPDRIRLVSGVLVDVDRVAKLNERLGTHGTDRTLASLGRLLKGLVRQERGFDRVARICGQSYLLFLGDTANTNAVSGAERFRHTVEAASFQVGEESLQLTISCAVAELGKQALPQFFQRLREALKEAKKAGRNRTSVCEGATAKVVELPQYKVRGRVIDVNEPR